MLAMGFCEVFLVARFSHILQFLDPCGVQFGSLFGVPESFENTFKTLQKCDFHTLEAFFAGMISRLDFVSDYFVNFEIFDVLRNSILGLFWCKKESKKSSKRGAQ